MGHTFTLPVIRLVQRLSMVLTLGSCAYMIFFLFSGNQDNSMSKSSIAVPAKEIGLVSTTPAFDLKPYDASANLQARDIFSVSADVSPSGAVENTPKGQLPKHLKIVGILLANPSQIVIEDSFANKTYFIDKDNPQLGIKMVRVGKDQMVINFQGQDIIVPITKN